MLNFSLAVLFFLISVVASLLNNAYYSLPPKEVKRQARDKHQTAQMLYRAVAYGPSLNLFMWLLIIASLSAALVYLGLALQPWAAFLINIIMLWFIFLWLPSLKINELSRQLVMWLTPVIAWLLAHTHKALNHLNRLVRERYPVNIHTGLYDRQDLLDLLAWQKEQPDSRINPKDLEIAENALVFGDKTVKNVMVPRSQVRSVGSMETVGPVLMDELHASGLSRFPVVSSKQPDKIVGTLYLKDLLKENHGGKVSQFMQKNIFFIHEDFSLRQALQAFNKTKHQLLVVVNEFEEYLGILTIEDVVAEIVGQPIEDDFDAYDNSRAVAEAKAKSEHETHEKAGDELKTPAETIEEEGEEKVEVVE